MESKTLNQTEWDRQAGMHVLLVAGGPADTEWIRKMIHERIRNKKAKGSEPDCRTILVGVDAGVLRIEEAGAAADLVIGDFDSVKPEQKERILKTYPEQILLDPVKDDTDMEAALRRILTMKPKSVTILGATGGRLDHLLANLRLLKLFADAGIPAEILDSQNRIRMLRGSVALRKKDMYGRYISLLPASGDLTDVTLRGFKYPLKSAVLPMYGSLGVSNELLEEEGEISFSGGYLYLLETRDEPVKQY
ncbi:MAG: thiamine diphosphokinase [Eubacterium sp.]|nr:thiamine diphosphokinase [Eubacterium sp.]